MKHDVTKIPTDDVSPKSEEANTSDPGLSSLLDFDFPQMFSKPDCLKSEESESESDIKSETESKRECDVTRLNDVAPQSQEGLMLLMQGLSCQSLSPPGNASRKRKRESFSSEAEETNAQSLFDLLS